MPKFGEDELDGLASRLATFADEIKRLADEKTASAASLWTVADKGVPNAAVARILLAQRQSRHEFLPRSLFHEPAWEILLALYIAHSLGQPLNVKNVVSMVDAPVTTSQRWIDQLVHMKLLHRVEDPNNRRRLEISLTQRAVEALDRYFASIKAAPSDPPGTCVPG